MSPFLLKLLPYKTMLIVGTTLAVIGSLYYYINHLKNINEDKQEIINQRDATITAMREKAIKDKLVYQINEKTLNDALIDQGNKIKQFEINEEKALKIYNNNINKIITEYTTKLLDVKDSNISAEIEYRTFKKIIAEELK